MKYIFLHADLGEIMWSMCMRVEKSGPEGIV